MSLTSYPVANKIYPSQPSPFAAEGGEKRGRLGGCNRVPSNLASQTCAPGRGRVRRCLPSYPNFRSCRTRQQGTLGCRKVIKPQMAIHLGIGSERSAQIRIVCHRIDGSGLRS